MEELYKILGLDSDAPTAKIVAEVKSLKKKVEDKDNLIEGLTSQLDSMEKRFDNIAEGVAEARIKDLVLKVQNETGYHVGGDENMQTLNRKAAEYIYASEEEQKNIWKDMKAHCRAYGAKVGLDDKINALAGDRDSGEDGESPMYRRAKALKDSGKAKTWDEAYAMVQEEQFESKEDEE